MSTKISVKYLGDLRTEAIHIDSKHKIITDAPKDNNGLGRKFSPTDLLASALGSCLLTIMGIVAQRHNIDMINSTVNIVKEMDDNPRRISKLTANISLNNDVSLKELEILKRAASHCPVHNSLNDEIKIQINFI